MATLSSALPPPAPPSWRTHHCNPDPPAFHRMRATPVSDDSSAPSSEFAFGTAYWSSADWTRTFAGVRPRSIARPISCAAIGSRRTAYGMSSRSAIILCPSNTVGHETNSSSFALGDTATPVMTSAENRG